MKVETQVKQNIENNDNSVQMMQEDKNLLSETNASFSNILSQQLLSAENAGNISSMNELTSDYNIDTISLSFDDAMFFVNLTKEGQFSVETTPQGDIKSIFKVEVAQNIASKKTIEVSNQIVSLIEKAQKTQKPVRITFDNDVSVILKIDKNGKVTAEFIPGSVEVENYLRNNISALRQKFDEQNLPYNDLLYRQNNRQQNKNKDKNKGEQ